MTTLTPSKLMGAEVKRKEDPRMITGTSTYVTDVVLPGMLWVAFVRSPHAHAKIKKIDARAALKVPGVRMVVTGDDIRTLARPIPPASACRGPTARTSSSCRALTIFHGEPSSA